MRTVKNVPSITRGNNKTLWFHGSPSELTSIRSGSTITGNKTLALAFSHKPLHVLIEVTEDEDTGVKTTTI